MAELVENWNGRLFGTNTGNLAANLSVTDSAVAGEIRFLDDVFGPVVYVVSGTWDGNLLALTGTGTPSDPNVIVGSVTVEGTLAVDGRLVGRWTSTLGTGGSFVLFPGPGNAQADDTAAKAAPPEELHVIQERLGAIRLYRRDVEALVELILSDMSSKRLAVTFSNGPTQSVLWSDTFLETVKAEDIRYVKLSINDAGLGGTSRFILIEFGHQFNEITVQGESQVWVAGKARVLRDYLSKRQSRLVTQFKIWNVSITQIILLTMIVVMPTISSLTARASFALLVAVGISALSVFHAHFIPVAVTNMGERRPSFLRFWPQWVSWIAGIISALVVVKATAWINEESKPKAAVPKPPAASALPHGQTPGDEREPQ